MTPREIELIEKAVAGDADALSELLQLHGPAVERSLCIDRVWQSVLEPADVMQVTYLEAFIHIERFDARQPESFVPWLRRVAENNLRDAVRALSRQKQPQPADRIDQLPGVDSALDLCVVLGLTTCTPSRAARKKEALALVASAVDALPADYSQVVRLYDLEGLPIADVAAAMNRSPGAVHMLRARGHDRLRAMLGPMSHILSSSA